MKRGNSMTFKIGDKVMHLLKQTAADEPMIIIGVPRDRPRCTKPCAHCSIGDRDDSPREYRVRMIQERKGLQSAHFLEAELKKA